MGHDVLAAVIEVVSGLSYGEYLRKNIFEPLGIKDFYFHLDNNLANRLSAQYAADFKTGKIEPCAKTNRFKLTDRYESGGAGLIGTVDAYSTVIEALSNGGVGINNQRILSENQFVYLALII